MDSFFAAMAMSAFAFGSGAPGTPARAAIPPQNVVADRVNTYRIPAGSVASALTSFADKNGLHLLYDARATRLLTSPGLSGRHSLHGGLDSLLKGTGLTYQFTPVDGTIAIRLAQAATGSQSDGTPVALPTINVEGAQGFGGAGPAQDPYNDTYELKDASTGTKTDTPIMETPLNVQVVPQQVLRDQQVITLQEALRNVSGVTVPPGIASGGNGRGNGIFIRGFPSSFFYRDGFRVAGDAFNLDVVASRQLANIASVEVLKGPGAMLYGIVEPGGVVNLATKEPLNAPYYSAQQQIGSLALYRTTVDATGPITDDKAWLYRINLSYENNGAPFGPFVDFTHSENIFVAPVVKWNVDPATWVKLEAEYSDDRSSLFLPFTGLYNGAFVIQPRSRNYGERSPERQTTLFTALTWSHQFDRDWSIKQQIAYNQVNLYQRQILPSDLLATDVGPSVFRTPQTLEMTATTYSTNVDITGHIDTFGALHTLLVGGDVYRVTRPLFAVLRANDFSIIDFWKPIHPGTPFPGFDFTTSIDSAQNTAGLYLQDQVELPYNFFLLAGARYQYIRQEQSEVDVPDVGVAPTLPLVGQALTPRYGLLWRPQNWVSFYGNYTEGFGPNTGTIFPGILAPPSNATSWEAGIKLELLDGRLRATADYYDLTKTNIPTADPLHPNFSLVVGEARSKGVEVDIQGEILPGWNVIASYANQDVRVIKGDGQEGQGAGLLPGQRFPNVPQNLASLWTTYEFQDEILKGLKIGGGYTYTGSQPVADFGGNPPGTFPLIPSYGLVDLMAAYSFKLSDAKVTAQVNVTNLFNKTYITAAQSGVTDVAVAPGLQGPAFISYGAPFAVLGSIRAEF